MYLPSYQQRSLRGLQGLGAWWGEITDDGQYHGPLYPRVIDNGDGTRQVWWNPDQVAMSCPGGPSFGVPRMNYIGGEIYPNYGPAVGLRVDDGWSGTVRLSTTGEQLTDSEIRSISVPCSPETSYPDPEPEEPHEGHPAPCLPHCEAYDDVNDWCYPISPWSTVLYCGPGPDQAPEGACVWAVAEGLVPDGGPGWVRWPPPCDEAVEIANLIYGYAGSGREPPGLPEEEEPPPEEPTPDQDWPIECWLGKDELGFDVWDRECLVREGIMPEPWEPEEPAPQDPWEPAPPTGGNGTPPTGGNGPTTTPENGGLPIGALIGAAGAGLALFLLAGDREERDR